MPGWKWILEKLSHTKELCFYTKVKDNSFLENVDIAKNNYVELHCEERYLKCSYFFSPLT